jgi:ribosomal silencing factor RsfS
MKLENVQEAANLVHELQFLKKQMEGHNKAVWIKVEYGSIVTFEYDFPGLMDNCKIIVNALVNQAVSDLIKVLEMKIKQLGVEA